MAYNIYSTLGNDQHYAAHDAGPDGLPLPPVVIKGGAGIATKHFITPQGVVTTITDAEHARLVADPVFKLHKDNGFLHVEQGRARDAEAVAANMSAGDPSRPLEPGDFDNDPDAPEVSTGPSKKARK